MKFPPPTEPQARTIWFALTGLSVALTLAILGTAVMGLRYLLLLLAPVLWPLAIAGVAAYLLDPVVEWLSKRGISRARGVILVFALATSVLIALIVLIVPPAIGEFGKLVNRIPGYLHTLQVRVDNSLNHPPPSLQRILPPEWQEKLGLKNHPSTNLTHLESGTNAAIDLTGGDTNLTPEVTLSVTNLLANLPTSTTESTWWMKALDPRALKSAGGWVAAVAPEIGGWLASQLGRVASWMGLVVGLALVPVYAFYFLIEKRGISSQWTTYLPVSDSRFKEELVFVLSSINEYLVVFFRGQVLVAMADGLMYTVGFLIINLPYALLLGLLATVLSIIPFLGTIVTFVLAMTIAAFQFGDWAHIFMVLAIFGVVQATEALVLQPKIIGDRVGLHPLTIIIALMVGTTLLGGILGGILAIPLTAALRVIMFRYVWKRPDVNVTPTVETAESLPAR